MNSLWLGLDLGQAQDATALVVLERTAARYSVRHLERFRIGTPYPEIVHRVTQILATPPLRLDTPLVVDGTGVGRAVVDMFTVPEHLVRIQITGGSVVHADRGYVNVPKRDLVGVVQRLFHEDRLKFAASLKLTSVLVAELQNFRVKISETGRDTYGAWREGDHDDLVLALALPLWYAESGPDPTGYQAEAGEVREHIGPATYASVGYREGGY